MTLAIDLKLGAGVAKQADLDLAAVQNPFGAPIDLKFATVAQLNAAPVVNDKKVFVGETQEYFLGVAGTWVSKGTVKGNTCPDWASLATYPTARADLSVTVLGVQGGQVQWVASSAASRPAEDGGTIKWHSTNTLGYWQRITTGSEVKMDWWGAASSVTPALVGVAANKAVALNLILRMGEGSYLFPVALELPSRLTLRGAHRTKTTLTQGTLATSIFTFTDGNTLTLSDFNAAPQNLAYDGVVLVPTRSKNILLERISVVNLCLWSSSAGITYATAVTSGAGKNLTGPITTNDCSGTGRGASVSGFSGIQGYYVDGMFVNNCQFDNYDHGIFYWGGDANHVVNGAIANERKAKNIQVRTSTIKNVREGGIWGSMGDGVKLFDNFCDTGGDVGIDVEGSINVEVVGNTVRGFANGNFTTFFLSQNNVFDRNTSITTVDGQAAFSIRNSSNLTDNDVITVRRMTARAEVGIGVIIGDTARRVIFDTLNCENVCLEYGAINTETVEFQGQNTFRFTRTLPAGKAGVAVLNTAKTVSVKNVRVESTVGQTGAGISLSIGDFNNAATGYVQDNTVRGFATDIKVDNPSGNAGISSKYYIDKNRSETNAAIVISELQTGAAKGTFIYERTNQGAGGALSPTFDAKIALNIGFGAPVGTPVPVPFSVGLRDSLGMINIADSSIIIRRSGLYIIGASVYIVGLAAGERIYAYVDVDGTPQATICQQSVGTAGDFALCKQITLFLTVGQKVRLFVQLPGAGAARTVQTSYENTFLSVTLL